MRPLSHAAVLLACMPFLPGCEAIVSWDTDRLDRDDADTSTDPVEDTVDVPEDTVDVPDTPVDTAEDTVEDAEPDEGPGECPPDDSTHLYIYVEGVVRGMVTGTPREDLYVAAVDPNDVMDNPTSPPILGQDVTLSDGSFDLGCINVKNVGLGLILLVDDNPRDGDSGLIFPTAVLAEIWFTDSDKHDIRDMSIYPLSNTLNGSLLVGQMGLDPATDGVVMGFVSDTNTHERLNGATVDRTTLSVDVEYPNADFTGVESDGDTSVSGCFVVTESLTMASLTAQVTGYTFDNYFASTVDGVCLFVLMEGTPI